MELKDQTSTPLTSPMSGSPDICATWRRHAGVGARSQNRPTRSMKISTKEVTDPDVGVSSDGSWLVFTALGHLFQLLTKGGVAKQLTFGPYYDSAPAISPDGTRVAFISDRDVSSQGNVFVLDLASGQIHQLTNEAWVDRPVWSPDGKSLVFLSYQITGPAGNFKFVGPMTMNTQVRRIRLADNSAGDFDRARLCVRRRFSRRWAARVVGPGHGDQRDARHEPT